MKSEISFYFYFPGGGGGWIAGQVKASYSYRSDHCSKQVRLLNTNKVELASLINPNHNPVVTVISLIYIKVYSANPACLGIYTGFECFVTMKLMREYQVWSISSTISGCKKEYTFFTSTTFCISSHPNFELLWKQVQIYSHEYRYTCHSVNTSTYNWFASQLESLKDMTRISTRKSPNNLLQKSALSMITYNWLLSQMFNTKALHLAN